MGASLQTRDLLSIPATMAAPILVFDSGVGGLSVLGPIRTRLPAAPIVYVADNGGFPYGGKSEMEVATRVCALLGRVTERFKARLIVIACNTASTIALAHVRAALAVPVVGTVPAIKPAAAVTKTKAIGVLGTVATVRQPYVDRLAAEFAGDCLVLRHGSERLAGMVEAKLRGHPPTPADYWLEMEGLLGQPGGERIDTVVLACTHFPLVRDELAAAAGRPINFVDGADGIARRTAYLLDGQPWPDAPSPGLAVFTSQSGDVDALAPALHSFGLETVAYL